MAGANSVKMPAKDQLVGDRRAVLHVGVEGVVKFSWWRGRPPATYDC